MKIEDLLNGKYKICVVGLGYVGLPLAVLLDTKYSVIGFDVKKQRVEELKKAYDRTNEIESDVLKNCNIKFSSVPEDIKEAGIIIITVPTPIDKRNMPDISLVKKATELVGKHIKKDSIIVYESTVYPGLTEEICVPILEKNSKLKWKKDFYIGYSPERVNPGDKEHTITRIKKIVSGDDNYSLDILASVYGNVIEAGIYKASSIKTAEAAKVIENIQRDLNIALINELAIIFNKMNIDVREVVEAASTKWNFIKYEPGLVGGHCIGVDPYYLTFKAQSMGYNPEVILSGRKINDSMGKYIAENTIKQMIKAGKIIQNSKILILGLTFKENINDIRNTKVIDIYEEFKEYNINNTYIYDPYADSDEAKEEYNIELIKDVESYKPYDVVILAVKHKKFIEDFNIEKIKTITNNKPVLIDIKGLYDENEVLQNEIIYWRL